MAPPSETEPRRAAKQREATKQRNAKSKRRAKVKAPSKRSRRNPGPDPVYGAGIALLGILMMGIAGAATEHYAFNVGSATAILGAILFAGAIALTSLRQWQQRRQDAAETSFKTSPARKSPALK